MGGKIEGRQIVSQLNYILEHIHNIYEYMYSQDIAHKKLVWFGHYSKISVNVCISCEEK
jgi:hypothetical protein